MNETYVTVIGRVASDLRFTTTTGGIAVVSFRVATTPRRYTPPNGWTDGHTSYVTVTCWRGLAENVRGSVEKGQPVVVHGRQSVRPWERNGRTGTSVDIDADSVGHDLRWGSTIFTKTSRGQEGNSSDPAAPDLAAPDPRTSDSWATGGDDRTLEGQPSSAETAGLSTTVADKSPSRPSSDGWAVPGAGGASAAA